MTVMDLRTKKKQLELVKKNGFKIRDIKNPSEKVQIAAVEDTIFAIECIKNPSEKVQLYCMKSSCSDLVLPFIEHPTDKVQLLATKKHKYSLLYLNNPSEKSIIGGILNLYPIAIDKGGRLSTEDWSFKDFKELSRYFLKNVKELKGIPKKYRTKKLVQKALVELKKRLKL